MVSSSLSFSSINVISTAVVVAITMILILSLAINATLLSDDNDDEGEALCSTGWWNSTSSSHCTRPGIVCNNAGSITRISISGSDKELGELNILKFSSFPNLLYLSLYDCGVNDSIPHQIGTLTNLTYIDPSSINLTGEQ